MEYLKEQTNGEIWNTWFKRESVQIDILCIYDMIPFMEII